MARLEITRSRACDQARSLVSLRLDDELSELEHVLLETHLSSCAACATFAAETEEVILALRRAPLEPLERRVTLPVPARRAYLRGFQTAAAGAVAAAAVVAGLVGITPVVTGGASADEQSARAFAEPVSVRKELQLYRRSLPSEGPRGPVIPV
jgi:anti-sigma factor RsiW